MSERASGGVKLQWAIIIDLFTSAGANPVCGSASANVDLVEVEIVVVVYILQFLLFKQKQH